MAFYKAATSQPFTIIANELLQDTTLTSEATGLMAFMLSLPDDWKYSQQWLQKQKQKLGRDKLARIIKELEQAGYIVRKHKQDAKGKMAGHDWVIYPTKQLQPSNDGGLAESLKTRHSVNPSLGKTVTTNKHINKETADSSKPAEAVFDFDLVLIWIVNQLTAIQKLTDLDKIFVEGALHDYCDSAEKPRRAQAFAWIEQALQNRLRTSQRSAKASAARDNLNHSVRKQLNAQASVIDQHTRNMQPRTMADRFDVSWAKDID